ncbi:MAG: phospholipase D family protein [Gemmataceae bacterium]|nr:phospholipase D family protein [Gemmataceae bacterium]
MEWPLDPMKLMWIQVATGALGMLTLVFLARWLWRKVGSVLDIQVYFSPKGGCQAAIVREMMQARSEILIQAYSFTADPLTFALVELKKQGVAVDIILDKSNEIDRYSDLHFFIENSMDVKIDHEHAIAHNKIMIIDRKVVITGSYNFTNQAEGDNAENVIVIKGNPELVNAYRENFFKHRDHAKPAQIREGEGRDRRGGPPPQKAAA